MQTGIIRPAALPPAEWSVLYSSFLVGAMYAIF